MTTHITHHAIRQQQLLNELGISVWVERNRHIIAMDDARVGVDVASDESQSQVDPNETRLESALLVEATHEVKPSAIDANQPMVEQNNNVVNPVAQPHNALADSQQWVAEQYVPESEPQKVEQAFVEHQVIEQEVAAHQTENPVMPDNHTATPAIHTEIHMLPDESNNLASNAINGVPEVSAYTDVVAPDVLPENLHQAQDMTRDAAEPLSSSQPDIAQPTQSIVPQAPFLLYALLYRNAVILCDDTTLTHEAAAQLWQNIQQGLGVSAIQINFPLSDGLPRQKNYAVATLSGWFYQLTQESNQSVLEKKTTDTPTFVLLGESEAPIRDAILTEQGLDLRHQSHDALITLPSISEMVSSPHFKKQLWQCIQG